MVLFAVEARTLTFLHIVNKMTKELAAVFVCVFTIAGCLVSVEEFAAVFNDLAEVIFDLLVA